jgi:hypothetical protein
LLLSNNQLSAQANLSNDLDNWEARFDTQSKEGKKAMLLDIIDKITLNGYNVQVEYKIKFDTLYNMIPLGSLIGGALTLQR